MKPLTNKMKSLLCGVSLLTFLLTPLAFSAPKQAPVKAIDQLSFQSKKGASIKATDFYKWFKETVLVNQAYQEALNESLENGPLTFLLTPPQSTSIQHQSRRKLER